MALGKFARRKAAQARGPIRPRVPRGLAGRSRGTGRRPSIPRSRASVFGAQASGLGFSVGMPRMGHSLFGYDSMGVDLTSGIMGDIGRAQRTFAGAPSRRAGSEYASNFRGIPGSGAPGAPKSIRPIAAPNPSRNRFSAAKHGKYVAGAVVGAGGLGMYANRSGRPTDRTYGRPTGLYGY
jgi:hypothetical protein